MKLIGLLIVFILPSISSRFSRRWRIPDMRLSWTESICGTDELPKDPNPIRITSSRTAQQNNRIDRSNVLIRLLMFYDDQFAFIHNNDERRIRNIILTMVNAVHLVYNHDHMKQLFNVTTEVVIIQQVDGIINRTTHNSQEYLYNFCHGVKSNFTDYEKISTAVLLTGYKLNSPTTHTSVHGVAHEKTACLFRTQSPCAVVECRHGTCAWVMAHEIGHSLGAGHDSRDNYCNPDDFIMSPTTGGGKTTFSPCTKADFTNYFNYLANTNSYCFDGSPNPTSVKTFYPNQLTPEYSLSLDEQCGLIDGGQFRLSNYPYSSDVCSTLWCQNEIFQISAHPAMEGSLCHERGFRCRAGRCIR